MSAESATWIGAAIAGICSIAAGLLAASKTLHGSEKKERLRSQRVALAIMKAFHAEMELGLNLLEQAKKGTDNLPFPDTAWRMYGAKLSERIIDVCIQCDNTQKTPVIPINVGGFDLAPYPASDFLQHVKNYYECICPNMKSASKLSEKARNQCYAGAQNTKLMVASIIENLNRIVNS